MVASLARPSIVAASLFVLLVYAAVARVRATPAHASVEEVSVVNSPEVRVASFSESALRELRRPLTPTFLKTKKRYAFTFNPGEPSVSYVVVARQDDGWIGVVTSTAPQPELVIVSDPREILWIDVTRAFSIQEVIP
jgi:hypothetical protein